MDKVFLLNATKENFLGVAMHTIAFGNEASAKHALKVIRDKYVEERKESIADKRVVINYDDINCFSADDNTKNDTESFDVYIEEKTLSDNATDDAIFESVADKVGYWNGSYHI